MKPYYEDGRCTIYHGDCREVWSSLDKSDATCLVIDPPFDDAEAVVWSATTERYGSELVFTDPRHIGDVFLHFGAPAWLFTWDTMSPWSVGPRRPLTQVKFAAWYGTLDEYDRDAALWGDPPAKKDHPSTKQTPLDGRRLTDLWRESLRWLHNPSAGSGSAGTERFKNRKGDSALRHAKPVGWVRCLIGNTSSAGTVLDPFMGSGTTLRAAKELGRKAIGIEIDEAKCEYAAKTLAERRLLDDEQMALPL